jgi:fused signal recognition particle receptor
MTEEKKKSWFQKFKNVVLGDEKDTISIPAEPKAGVQEQQPGEGLDTVQAKPEEELVRESLQDTEVAGVENKEADTTAAETAVTEEKPETQMQPVTSGPKTEEELVKETLQTEELKKIEEDTVSGTEPKENGLLSRPQPNLNVKLEIGKGRVPFQDSAPATGTPQQEEPEAGPVEEGPASEEDQTEKKRSWFTKMVNTLNAPIEFKIETPEGDDSFIAKLKGNVSFGLGKPVVERTDEDIERWKESLREKLSLTRESFIARLERLMHGRTKIDDELLEEIEEILLESDVGVEMTDAICNKLRALAKEKRFLPSEVMPSLFDYLRDQLDAESQRIIVDDSRLNIIMMVGVNGTGKTTTTGKMAAKFRISDYSVILAAADTFRAAAIDQLDVWSQRAQVPLIRHQENSDAAAVVYDAIKAAKARNTNVLLVDTAGRLHNKSHLMEELKKIKRIIDREAPEAKLEVLLVLDGTTGQNGLKQAEVFGEAVKLTGVVLTKLDGTAKGGVIFSIKNSLKLPIKLVGVGEGIEDLRDFEPQIFIDALFSEKSENIIEESTKIRS